MKKIAWLLPLCLLLAACRADVSEPEELYLVSAIGFDAGNADLRVSVEVPLTRENEADKMEVLVFDGTGNNLTAAMRDLRAKLGKKLFFGHCALAIFGDGVSGDALRAALDFLSGNEIPLSVTVVSAPDARELLARGTLSAPAAGYEIPDILRLLARDEGLPLRCRYYEIAAHSSDFTLPRFLPSDLNEAVPDRFVGMRSYRDGKAAVE